jgi:hypothetical protein
MVPDREEMTRMKTRQRSAAFVLVWLAGAAHAQFTGPSSSQSPYIVPTTTGVTTTSILTVGDSIGGYRMVGIPDGLGAMANGDGTFDLVMTHELGGSVGAVRAHGQTGAFVSRWNINSTGLLVNSGRDHNTSPNDAYEWTGSGWSNAPGSAQRWNRFCSADLAAPTAYRFGALGTSARLFLTGEESGAEGRAYAHVVSGPAMNQTWQLPAMGRFSWENAVANPFPQQKTVVMGLDDSSVNGQVYMYLGDKTGRGNDIERAGLTNGGLYGVSVAGLSAESRTTGASGRFSLYSHGDVTNTAGSALDASSVANGVTSFLRPEDGAWDPRPGRQNDFYFLTTDRYNTPTTRGSSRLYRMRFDDITDPTAGGEITMLLDGFTDGPQMMDNMCIDSLGRILIQEDIGSNDALSKVWMYDIRSQMLAEIAQHDPSRFTPGAAGFLTRDEESSGIIDARDILGDGWFLLDVQAHYGNGSELVEGGQLVAMYVDPAIPAPGALAVIAIGGLMTGRRRRT